MKKKVFMVHNSNTTCVLYEVQSKTEGALLRIFPLITSRDFHFTVRSGYLSFFQKADLMGVQLESSNGFTFSLSSNLEYHFDPKWYYNLEYEVEKQRGLNFQEDAFNPGYFEGKLKMGTSRFFIAEILRAYVEDVLGIKP